MTTLTIQLSAHAQTAIGQIIGAHVSQIVPTGDHLKYGSTLAAVTTPVESLSFAAVIRARQPVFGDKAQYQFVYAIEDWAYHNGIAVTARQFGPVQLPCIVIPLTANWNKGPALGSDYKVTVYFARPDNLGLVQALTLDKRFTQDLLTGFESNESYYEPLPSLFKTAVNVLNDPEYNAIGPYLVHPKDASRSKVRAFTQPRLPVCSLADFERTMGIENTAPSVWADREFLIKHINQIKQGRSRKLL